MLLKFALFFHVISAVFWIGGMLFLTLVVAPFLQTLPDPRERSKIYQFVGKKYRLFGWGAIIILLVTGPVILYKLHGLSPSEYFSAEVWSTGLGKALAVKLAFVFIIVVSSFTHDFWLGPKARNSSSYTLIAKVFGRGNLLIALIIVIFAVILRAGGF
jgi:uncharacterized membrane protein